MKFLRVLFNIIFNPFLVMFDNSNDKDSKDYRLLLGLISLIITVGLMLFVYLVLLKK